MPRVAVVHHSRGRLRLRLPRGAKGHEVAAAVRGYPGVQTSRSSPQTGSLLVEYRPDATSADTIVEAIEGALGKFLTEGVEGPEHVGPELPPPLAVALKRTVAEANAGVARLTGGHVDMRVLVALGMAGWGLWQLYRGRRMWHQPLWYAYSLFMDYSPPRDAMPIAHRRLAEARSEPRRLRAVRGR